ncbi:MAG TPA: hypothetical protein VEU29_04775 [Actinomycetota bacterium]|nr:hypothetical protein [Actinomycetota bacterium]
MTRKAVTLARPVARTVNWSAVGLSGALALAAVYVLTRSSCAVRANGEACLDLAARVQGVRLGGILLALGAATLMDDPTDEAVASSATGLAAVRGLRVAVALPILAAFWGGALWLASRNPAHADVLPAGDLTLEVSALLMVALAGGGAWVRRKGGRASLAAAPTVLCAAVLAALMPEPARLIVEDPADPAWATTHSTWVVVLILAVAAALWWSRDPGAPRLVQAWVRGRRGRERVASN